MMSNIAEKRLPGRKNEAARNDGAILDAARTVFLADPKAPVSAVAERAGVGIGALYRRYPNKEALLRTLCHEGLQRYNAEADRALNHPDGWVGLVEFLEHVVEADTHSLTTHLAGTFTPDAAMLPDVARSGELTAALVDRAHRSGRLCAAVGAPDLGLVLEACAAITSPDRDRTLQLRRRVLALLVAGLTTNDDLPGPPPGPSEFVWRWQRP